MDVEDVIRAALRGVPEVITLPASRDEYVVVPLNAMRCSACGHRLDDMGGCDSCAADLEALLAEGDDHDR